MSVEVEKIPLSFLEHEQPDNGQKRLFESWQSNNGQVNEQLLELSDEVVLLSEPKPNELPEMLSMGRNSLASRTLGAGWRDDAIRKGEAKWLAPAYTELLESREPVYEWIRYQSEIDGLETEMVYTRALFLFEAKNGLPYITTMAKCLKFYQKDDSELAASLQSPPLSFPKANNYPLLGMDGSPIATR